MQKSRMEYYVNSTENDMVMNFSGEQNICSTISGRTPNLPCIFPFTFDGIIYDK